MANETAKKSTTKTKEVAEKSAAKATKKPEKKSKKGLVAGIIAAAAVVIIGVVVAVLCICLNKTDPSDPKAKLSYSDSFFIYDSGKYTLWNADGKRVTEDEYSYSSNFVGGYAFVKKDNQSGVIKDDGGMSVEFGKYGSITERGGLYLAQDGNTKEYYLLTGSGRELERGEDIKISAPSDASGFAVVKSGDKVKVYTYEGKLVAETEATGSEEPAYYSSHDFGLVYYNGQNWVFDARDGRVLAEFEGDKYGFDSVTDDRTMVLLENRDKSEDCKLLKDGKVYDLNETKYYALTDLDGVIGYDNFSEIALLDNDYKVATRVSDYLELKDYQNYATEADSGNVEVYYNGEMVKDFGEESSIASSGVLYEDLYGIEVGDKAMFYRLDGSVGIDHEYRKISSLFDKHHHAVVSDKEGEYYLIDAKGNQIGETTFKSSTVREGGYELRDNDGKYAIANKDGKLATEFKYSGTYYRSNAEPHNIWTGRNTGDSYDVIDVENGKVLLEGVNVDSFYTNYFTVRDGNKVKYYTYSGEMFHEVEK